MAEFRQKALPGGHQLLMEAGVADGRLLILETWQHILDEDGGIAGSQLVLRTAILNDCLVKDPGYAQQLLEEARRQ